MNLTDMLLCRFLLISINRKIKRLSYNNKLKTYFYPDKTPSDLPMEEVARILREIEKNFAIADNDMFNNLLIGHMNSKRLKASELYEVALIEKSYFYQIVKGTHIPSRDIVIRLCLSLKLSVDESNALMKTAGYCFFDKNKRDIIIMTCIQSESSVFIAETLLMQCKEKSLAKSLHNINL